jgi:translation initiation factor 1
VSKDKDEDKKIDTEPGPGLSHNPFAALAEKKASLPPGPAPQSKPAPGVRQPPARAVVRLERKGRGGKEVTVVEKLELKPAELEKWGKELKQSLGCGGVVEGKDILVQGDQRERVKAWLEGRGVKKISMG